MTKQQVIFTDPHAHDTKSNPPSSAEEVNRKHIIPSATASDKEIRKNSEKFEELIDKTERVLLKIKTVFPFDFFPDTIIIDENKVSIIRREFFLSAQIQSIPIEHVQEVQVETSIIFATLRILPVGYSIVGTQEVGTEISYLWKKDAIKAKRIISGLLIGMKQGIDFSKVETPHFVEKIEELGKVT